MISPTATDPAPRIRYTDWSTMQTLAESPQPGPAPLASEEDAVKFMASGHSAATLLSRAASPQTVRSVADGSGTTSREARNLLLALSAAVGQLEDEGMTPERCRARLGLAGIHVPAQHRGRP